MKRVLHICGVLGLGAWLLGLGRAPAAEGETHSISGTIAVEGRTRHDSVDVWVDSLHSSLTDSLGGYVIAGLEDGDYLVQAEGAGCLYHHIDTVRVSGSDVTGIDDTLVAPDVVPDGRINLLDAGAVLAHYHAAPGDPLWNESLDIDGSGRIDSLDLALLMRHWRETGDARPVSCIVVTDPNNATVWYRGHGGAAAWDTGDHGGNVSISLYRGGVWTGALSALTANDGSHEGFIVPRGLPTGSDYHVRVCHDLFDFGYSSAFRIDARIEVLDPTSATVWMQAQKNVQISWDTADLGGAVAILLHKGASIVDTIASSTPNDGSYLDYDLTYEHVPGTDYRVQVVYDEARSAFSDSFEVRWQTGPIVVVEPGSSTRWVRGQENVPIVWETGNLGGNVSIFLKGSRLQGVVTIVSSTPNDGSYLDYDLTYEHVPGTDYRVQVVFDKDHSGLSDFFEIEFPVEPLVGVTEPNAGIVWTLGQENVPVFWNGGPAGDVSIDLYEGGALVGTMASATPNRGSFVEYDVPPGLTQGMRYQVRVSFAGGSSELSSEFEIRAPGPPGWSFVYPRPQGNTLNGVSFTDENTGTAVGNCGTIMRTTDAGAAWAAQWSGTRNALNGVSFVDPYTGIAVGTRGTILRTTDGGATWVPQRSGTSMTLNSIAFMSATAATIVGDDGIVLQSADGGVTWTGHIPSANFVYGYAIDLKSVSFSDALHGTAVGGAGTTYSNCEYVILRTNDGGVSWTLQGISALGSLLLTAVAFLDSNTGVVVGNYLRPNFDGACCFVSGYVDRTTDGGATWARVASGVPNFSAVSYIGNNVFVAVGGGVIRSTDGGASWGAPLYPGSMRAVSYPNPTLGFAVGAAGAMYKTVNYGAAWVNQTTRVTDYNFYSLSFAGLSTGFAASDVGTLFRTTDGGASWTKQKSSTTMNLCDVSFATESAGMAVGWSPPYSPFPRSKAAVVGTTDGGTTWATKLYRDEEPGAGAVFRGVALVDKNTAAVVGRRGLILRTTDGGATWLDQTSGTSADLMSVFFTDADTGTVVGCGGTILRTTDGGATWGGRTSGTTVTLAALYFTDAMTGTVIGRGGTILRTTDGGATWTSQTSGTTVNLSGVFFTDSMTGTIVGDGGTILRTTDGGATWAKQVSSTSINLHDVWFFDSMTGIVVGESGVVLKTTTGGE